MSYAPGPFVPVVILEQHVQHAPRRGSGGGGGSGTCSCFCGGGGTERNGWGSGWQNTLPSLLLPNEQGVHIDLRRSYNQNESWPTLLTVWKWFVLVRRIYLPAISQLVPPGSAWSCLAKYRSRISVAAGNRRRSAAISCGNRNPWPVYVLCHTFTQAWVCALNKDLWACI